MPDKSLMQDLAISVGQHLGASKAFKNTFPGTSCNNKFPEGGKLLGDDVFCFCFLGGELPQKRTICFVPSLGRSFGESSGTFGKSSDHFGILVILVIWGGPFS